MRIVIGGAGEVGYHIARVLRSEGHDIVIIENDAEMVKRAKTIDALVVEGSASSPEVLNRAGIGSADIYLAVTGSDEVNLLSCALASARLTRTLCRVNEFGLMRPGAIEDLERLGVKNVLCPELLAARTLARLVETPSVADVRPVARGEAFVLTVRVTQRSRATGTDLGSIEMPLEAKVIGVIEERNVILPRREYVLEPGQRALVMLTDLGVLPGVERLMGARHVQKVRKVVIWGANDIGIHIARQLERRIDVTIMTDSTERAEEASAQLERAHPILGDATNTKDMEDANIGSADVFIAAGEDEERNALSCFHAKRLGAKRTLAVISNHDLADMASSMGLDIVVNPRWTTIGSVLENVHEVEFEAVHLMHRDEAQLIELEVGPSSPVVGRSVERVDVKEAAEVAAILRRGLAPDGSVVRKVKIARDSDIVMSGDRLVVFALREAIPRLRAKLK